MREPDKSRTSTWWRVRFRLGRSLVKDEDGGVLVYMTILIPVMMGIIGLAVDGSRLYILNTEQSDLADAAALAAARELDRTADGVIAAEAAAHNVVTNDPRWASDAARVDVDEDENEREVHISSVLFCPDQGCGTTMDLAAAQANPVEARFVQVITEMRLVVPSFLMAVGAVSQARSNALAVAGASMVACNVTPLMMCQLADPNILQPGVMFELKDGNQLGPGAFALVDPPNRVKPGGGAPDTWDLLASTAPNFCFVNEVSVATGSRTASIQKGINPRFDEYPPGNPGKELAALYPPAPNVTKGKVPQGEACKFKDAAGPGQLMALPVDECFLPENDDCPATILVDKPADYKKAPRYGNGQWDRESYWNANHSTKVTKPDGWETFTRYQTYIWELSLDPEDGEPKYTNMPYHEEAEEDPQPQCYPSLGGTVPGKVDRRSIYVAVADCSKITGNATPNLESAQYGEFFLTHPSEGGEIWAEFVRWIEPDDETGILRRIVQLYQ